ncbi:ABC transporter ATP-binding protein [Cellulomonas phragmiteti]|uniref:ABC transporter ATP-binding protein n=1 Tax=Cellulomonas phragmiteti TaxID=478780 RepID=A0ABQ4DPT8_9CELL|nr:ATP-binding cassette domain-containing protein [Cellulomonas phragmiteti]GIG41349.1 ABC transporter ATP-binding protein [Cellulomonas phragmiteti]
MRLVVDEVTVRYPRADRHILADASLTVEPDRTLAVLGPSGSGKSTLLSVLGGLVTPTRGTARVAVAEGLAPALRDVTAWVLQTVNVLPERSALDNVAVAARTRGLGREESRAVAADRLADVGLARRAGDAARVLSGGELQRVVIARALASARPFLLADEPTGQLDRATSEAVLDALFTTSVGAGVVVVTHDLAVAARCDSIVRIDDGRVVTA